MDSGRSLGRESTSSARSVDLGHLESIELCCGPTTCCGHNNLPEALDTALDDLVDERTRTRARRGAAPSVKSARGGRAREGKGEDGGRGKGAMRRSSTARSPQQQP